MQISRIELENFAVLFAECDRDPKAFLNRNCAISQIPFIELIHLIWRKGKDATIRATYVYGYKSTEEDVYPKSKSTGDEIVVGDTLFCADADGSYGLLHRAHEYVVRAVDATFGTIELAEFNWKTCWKPYRFIKV